MNRWLPGVVLHARGDGSQTVLSALQALHNLRLELPDETVELTVQGPAAALVLMPPVLDQVLRAADDENATVLLCRNSLVGAGATEPPARPGLRVVPAAVAHVATRQLEGWAYIRL